MDDFLGQPSINNPRPTSSSKNQLIFVPKRDIISEKYRANKPICSIFAELMRKKEKIR